MKTDLSLDEIHHYLSRRNNRLANPAEPRHILPSDECFRPVPGIIGLGVPLLAMTGLALGMLGAFGVNIPGLP